MTATLQRTMLRTSRLLDFASEKELVAQTGHQRDLWPLVIVKELVDNALDACEEAGIAPAIEITVDDDGLTVEDNGPGIPADVVKHILDFHIRVSSREAYVSPTRGAQGNALKTIVAMPFVLDGNLGRVIIEAKGLRHSIEMKVDRIRQDPVIGHETESSDRKSGNLVKVIWPFSPRSNQCCEEDRFLQFADDYTWLNPHLTLTTNWYGKRHEIPATSPQWTKWKPSDPTSPHWYSLDRLERLIAGYVSHDADVGRERTVRELVSEFRGLSGSAKQKAVLGETDMARAPLSRLVNGNELDRLAIEGLLASMQAHSKPVKPEMLGLIGRDHFQKRFEAEGCEMETFDYRKALDVTDDVPWIVETAFGWCPAAKTRRLVTGVNWSPGIVNPFREMGRFGTSLDTVLADQRATRNEPVILVLHMTCPRVEYTDRGKSAVVVRS
jgi:DNA topoisomerase VI subunit B